MGRTAAFDHTAVLDNVRRLRGEPSPPMEHVERVLTDGYACVLRTEAERSRLRDRLETCAASLGPTPRPAEAVEIATLAQGIARAGSDITELREALEGLAVRARGLRVA